MTPILDPALSQLWRDPHTLQLGLAPDAPVVGGLDTESAALLRNPAATTQATEVLRGELARIGVPTDHDTTAVRGPLSADLAAETVRTGSRRSAHDRLCRRAKAYVRIEGAGRVGAAVATLLAAAGVGRLHVEDPNPVDPADMTPLGARLADAGLRRDAAWEAAAARQVEQCPADPDPTERPQLVVLTPVQGLGREAAQALVRAETPHLLALVHGVTAVVGPLVLPGRSSCVQCHDLHRTVRDPAWPRLLAQAEHQHVADPPYDLALTTLAAAQVAMQTLSFLVGDRPATIDGTLETSLRDGITRRRSWPRHPECGCRWGDPE